MFGKDKKQKTLNAPKKKHPAASGSSGNNEKKVADPKSAPKTKKQTEDEDQLLIEDFRPSSKLIHQFIPFILYATALLISVFLIGVEWFHADMGIIGNLICSFLCGLFGVGAFFMPIGIVTLGVSWRSVVDNRRTRSKIFVAVASLLLFSMLAHVILRARGDAIFHIPTLWESGTALHGGGVLGGLLCELLIALVKEIGSIIIIVTALCIALMILFSITPKNVWTYIRYKNKLRREKREERLAKEREKMEAEAHRREEERLAEEERRRFEEAAAAKEREAAEAAAAKAKKAEDTVYTELPENTDDVAHSKTQVKIVKKSSPDIMLSMPEPADPREDDNTDLQNIFSSSYDQPSGKMITIDLPPSGEPVKVAPVKTEQTPVREASDGVKVSMKVDEETLSELESLRGDDAYEEDEELFDDYAFPPTSLMNPDTNHESDAEAQAEMNANAQILKETLASFNIGIKDSILCSRGPTITRYELRPEVGVRVRSIANLVDDISLSLATSGVRIEAPIPNKPYVGIEVPNQNRMTVFLRSLIEHEKFVTAQSKLTACLGADVGGNPVFFDIAKMPHLLIAGATGMGKSVCINSIIISLLYKATPDEVKLILIDPKKVEFNIYKEIPHLYAPVVSDPKKAAGALASAVAEMERRFELIEAEGVRDINNYNAAIADDPGKEYMPKMVIIIDELADLMMTAPGEVESSICRLAQKARAAGIHIIIGTQRPSVDVITGLIKANVPSRIACTVSSQVDSRTIIDIAGAEKLIGKGDMLFAPVGISKPMRVQGAFISEGEVESIVEFIKNNNRSAEYNKDFISVMESEAAKCGNNKKGGGEPDGTDSGDTDPKFREAVKLAIDAGKISTSLMQRNLGVGYGRAAKIIDRMEELGYVSPPDGNKPRRVLITMQEFMEKVVNDDIDDGGASAPSDDAEE